MLRHPNKIIHKNKTGFLSRTAPLIKKLDRFSEPVQVNFDGDSVHSTFVGSIVTAMLLVVLSVYGIKQFQTFVNQEDPQIAESVVMSHFTYEDEINLNQFGFKMAFAMADYKTMLALDDPDMVKIEVYVDTRKNLKPMGR